jgi:NhaP-type Na+/H+ or K+/H+ antiporter
MLGIDFQTRYPKEARRITMFILVVVLVSVLLGTFFPKLLTKRQQNKKENQIEKRTKNTTTTFHFQAMSSHRPHELQREYEGTLRTTKEVYDAIRNVFFRQLRKEGVLYRENRIWENGFLKIEQLKSLIRMQSSRFERHK